MPSPDRAPSAPAPFDLQRVRDPQRAWAYRPEQPLQTHREGPLAGLTFSVKDLYGVPGWPLTASTRAPVPDPGESVLVRRLLDLGAAALGKTHLHEIALGITGMNGYGGTAHPRDPERVPGGSSSGAAVSVALGQVDFALGTDTGGSIRVPAAWCGVVGYKPTKNHPAWSTEGALPLSWTCDHAGPLARDLSTIVQVHQALNDQAIGHQKLGHQAISGGASGEITAQDWRGVRVGLWLPDGWTDAAVRDAVLAYADDLRGRGAVLTPVELPEMLDAYSPIVLSEAARVHAGALQQPDPGFLPFTLASLRSGAALTEAQVQAAHARRARYRELLDRLLSACDVLLAPAVPTPPPLTGQEEVELLGGPQVLRRATLRITAPFSLLGAPTLALPALARDAGARDVGIQLVGRHGEDERLLGLGLTLQG